MEPNSSSSSKKRRQPSSSIFSPLFSVFSRRDYSQTYPRQTTKSESPSSSPPSIKDLRTRRVFTPKPKPTSPDKPVEDKIGASVTSIPKEYSPGVDDGLEDVETTPPEAAGVHVGNEVVKNGSVNSPNGSVPGEGFRANQINGNDKKPGPSPIVRGKLYKSPGSFSYRRLLPYLMDIANNDPGNAKDGQSQNHIGVAGECPMEQISGTGFQDILMDEPEKDGTSKFAAKPLVLTMPNGDLSCVDESDIKVINHSMTNDLPKDLCPTSVVCPREIDQGSCDQANGQIIGGEIEGLCQDAGEGSFARGLSLPLKESNSLMNGHVDVCFADAKSNEEGGAKETHAALFCDSQDANSVNSGLSVVIEKDAASQPSESDNHSENGATKTTTADPSNVMDGETGKSVFTGQMSKVNHIVDGQTGKEAVAGQINNANDGVLCPVDNSNVSTVQMTVADSNILAKAEANKVEGFGVGSAMQKASSMLGDGRTFNTKRPCLLTPSGTNKSMAKNKLVLTPCSRLKLYKSPDSFSYRRLLPFLIEISKEDSCIPTNDDSLNSKNEMEKQPLSCPPLSGSLETNTDRSSENGSSSEDCNGSSNLLPNNSTCSQEGPNSNANHLAPQAVVKLDCDSGVENVTDGSHSQAECYNRDLQSDADAKISSSQSSLHTGDECVQSAQVIASSLASVESDGQSQEAPPSEAPIHVGVVKEGHVGIAKEGPKKGILKRNPRGCRGLCDCLNCASFRLHAERAFEFSRNQMMDAEEVAIDLMKQLSCLRNMLESLTADNSSSLPVNEVNEACKRASDVEETAKDRLLEMNDHLNAHCRITCFHRPRVTFNGGA